jgi:membrane associated rhomboid family serine protease
MGLFFNKPTGGSFLLELVLGYIKLVFIMIAALFAVVTVVSWLDYLTDANSILNFLLRFYRIIGAIISLIYFIPFGAVHSLKRIPWVTIGLIAANILIYVPLYIMMEIYEIEIDRSYIALRLSNPNPIGGIVSIFIHGSPMHLFGNMIFLFTFGSHVEVRIGWKRYLLLYFASGLASGILWGTVEMLTNADYMNTGAVGASGAISGIQILYLFRCWFNKIRFLPNLALLPVLKLPKLNPVFFILYGISGDLIFGTMGLFGLIHSNTAYFGHIGGYICGFWFAWSLKLWREGEIEWHRTEGLEGSKKITGLGQTREHLQHSLEHNSRDAESWAALARLESNLASRRSEANIAFKNALKLYVDGQNFDSAVEIYHDFRDAFISEPLYVKTSLRLAKELRRRGYADRAASELEILRTKGHPGEWADEALLLEGIITEKDLNLPEISTHLYLKLIEKYPKSEYAARAAEALRRIPTSLDDLLPQRWKK